jgi:hypothetical protein
MPDLDLSVFPTDLDLQSSLTADAASGNLDTGLAVLQFDFCLRFNGQPWVTIPVGAPSPEAARLTMSQWVSQVANPTLVRMGYPPNMCTFSPGSCN